MSNYRNDDTRGVLILVVGTVLCLSQESFNGISLIGVGVIIYSIYRLFEKV